jgi:hypothetical protein
MLVDFIQGSRLWLNFRRLFWEIRCILEGRDSLRSVWRITHPLAAAWNIFNPSRAIIAFQHWGVVIARFDNPSLHIKVHGNQKKINEYLGEIHELKRNGKIPHYEFREWRLADVQKGTIVTYVGQTKLNDEEIIDKGDTIIIRATTNCRI